MKRLWIGLALGISLTACSGTPPFGTTTSTDGSGGAGEIPDALAGTLRGFTYDPANQTLSIDHVEADGNAVNGPYRRRANLDRGGYEAYTAQHAANGRHSTAYVRDIDGTRAAVVVTGGQYGHIYSGSAYSNTSYSPRVVPDSSDLDRGNVYYTGRYVGLLNVPGSEEDLILPSSGSVLSRQAAEVTGDMQITGDFATSNVDGVIYNRNVVDYSTSVQDVELEGTGIAADGTFFGTATQDNGNTTVGSYGGIFGGTGATAVAGVVELEDHIDGVDDIIERGAFVLSECVPPNSGPNCDQVSPPPAP